VGGCHGKDLRVKGHVEERCHAKRKTEFRGPVFVCASKIGGGERPIIGEKTDINKTKGWKRTMDKEKKAGLLASRIHPQAWPPIIVIHPS